MARQPLTLTISGMSCGHCVAAVRRALDAVAGVTVQDVQIGTATVDVDPSQVTPADLASAVDEAGFRLEPVPSSLGGAAAAGTEA